MKPWELARESVTHFQNFHGYKNTDFITVRQLVIFFHLHKKAENLAERNKMLCSSVFKKVGIVPFF